MVKVNREELQLFLSTDDVREGAAKLHAAGANLVFITLDADGCFYSIRRTREDVPAQGHVPGRRVQPVDTTGAGDTFVGSILYHLAKRADEQVSVSDIHTWVEFAVSASALVTTKRGSIPALPTFQEVLHFQGRA